MAEIDSLEIKISASAEQANKAIRHLTRSLGALSSSLKFDTSSFEKLGKINSNNFKKLGEGLQSFANAARSLQGVDGNNFNKLSDGLSKLASIDPSKLEALGKIDGNSFRGLGDGVKALSVGLKDLKGVSAKKFETLASGIERLGAIQVGNMQTVASALTSLADGIRTLSGVNFDNRNLQNLINSLTRLSNANVGSLESVDFTGIGNKIKELATALSGADKVEQNTISMVNAIAKLAGAGANIGAVTTELPRLGTALKDFMNTMSGAPILASETIAFTQAIGQLASAGSKAKTVADSLEHLGNELKRFMQTMATAPSVSAGVIRMTEALARLANAGGGSGRAASSLGNALNGLNISAIRLMPNMSRLSVSIKKLGTQMSKTVNNVKSLGRQLLGAMGIVGGVYGAIRGIKKSIDISSDLTEVQNVVDVTFKDMAYKVEEFAETSIEQFGLSELSLKQYASRFQAMGSAMGINSSLISDANSRLSEMTNGYISASDSMSDVSLNLTKLTADMASFYNVEQKVVAEDLAAIFTGQTRPLRDYGLDLTQATLQEWALKQGLDADIKSMSQAEKTMLRYQYVMANTGAAHDDFSRTAKTWANQTRILKQNFEQLASVMGRSFISALKPLVEALNAAMSHIIAFAETVSNALGKIFGWKFEKGSAAGGLADLVGDAGALEEGLGGAEEAAKKLNKQLRAFDELNVINTDDGDGAGGAGAGGIGAGGAAGQGGQWVQTDSILQDYESSLDTLYKLGDYIGTKLSEAMERIDWNGVYEKARNFGSGLANFLNGLISPQLFSNIGTTVAGALNTALHFLDSFGLWFNWKKFGDSLAAGLLGFLNNIQWDVALSAAKNWGRGIATTLNNFLTPETFSATGHAIAKALNTAIQFALSFGQTFDFKNLGESIAAGINDFFATFNFKDLAATINVWAKGILDAVITALDKTDWDLIGKQIGEFLADIDLWAIGGKVGKALWKAINAGIKTFASSFSKAPVKTTLITLVAIPKALKAIADSRLIKGIQNLVKYFGNLASTAKLVITALAGNVTSLSALMTQFPRFGSMVSVAAQAFAEFRSGLSSQGFGAGLSQGLATLNNGITNFRNSLSGLQKGVITAVAGFAEFTVISDVFEGLTLGSENLVAGIGKIAAAAGIAGAAMYTALGPAGIVIAAITGVAAAIKGINDALDEIHIENVGNAINNALSNPGGTPIDEVARKVSESISSIGDSFSTISEKSSALDDADKKIEDIKFQIELVRAELEAGTITAEEATAKFNNLLSELQTAVSTKIGAINEYMLSAFGEGGTWGQAWENAGFNASEAVGKTLGLTSEMQTKFNELVTQLAEADPNSPEWANLQTQLYGIIGDTDKLQTAMSNFEYNMNSIDIDYSKLVGKDGQLDSTEVEAVMARVSESVQKTYDDIELAGEEMAKQLNDAIESAKVVGDNEAVAYFSKMLEELPAVINTQKQQVGLEAVAFTNTLQEDLVGGIDKVVENAQASWDNLSRWDKTVNWGNDSQKYVDDYVAQYQSNVVDPISQQVESSLSQLGIDGAGWASNAMGEIFTGMWEYNMDTREMEISENFSSVVKNAISASESSLAETTSSFGSNIISGIGNSIDQNSGTLTTSIGTAMSNMVKEAKEKLGIHSPSTVFAEIGSFVIEGLLNGITNLVGSITETWESMKSTAIEVWETVSSSLSEKWATTKETAITTWGEIKENLNTTWDNMKATAETNFGAIKDYIAEKWADSESSTDSTWGRIQETVSSIASDVSGVVSDKFAEITGSFSGFSTNAQSLWSSTWNNIQSTLNSILGSIKDAVGSAFDWISNKINSIQSAANGVVSGSLGGVVSGAINGRTYTATAQIPMFAKGGVFRGGNPFMAIVNDQPSGQTNVEAPLKVIKQALREELASFTDNFDTLQLTPAFEVGQFQPMPPPEFDFESRRQGVYEIAAEVQRENSRVYNNSDGYDNYSEELSLLMSQNQLLRRQNELLEQILRKPAISNDEIGKRAVSYIQGEERRLQKSLVGTY